MKNIDRDCPDCRELARGLVKARLDNDYSRESDIIVLMRRHHDQAHAHDDTTEAETA